MRHDTHVMIVGEKIVVETQFVHQQNVNRYSTIMGKNSAPFTLGGDNLKKYLDQS